MVADLARGRWLQIWRGGDGCSFCEGDIVRDLADGEVIGAVARGEMVAALAREISLEIWPTERSLELWRRGRWLQLWRGGDIVRDLADGEVVGAVARGGDRDLCSSIRLADRVVCTALYIAAVSGRCGELSVDPTWPISPPPRPAHHHDLPTTTGRPTSAPC